MVPNPGQELSPKPPYGLACYVDTDGDGLLDPEDNCPELANAAQVDYDYDDWGDACDPDDDEDGEFDAVDNCRLAYNYDQTDRDGDGIGAACDD
ncbi:MAG TPA: thrombospondin type 3 repeat-containing protein, partial [Solirubrobacteraceae bacterium]|nr:thrombospondin type 3 repeat-containing protein [Solirubrobacteraceae bacterium]